MSRHAGSRHLLPREQAVVLMLAGDRNDDELIAALRGRIDWEELLRLAHTERASSELYRRLRGLTDVEVPTSVLATAQRLAMVSDFEMLHLEECLRQVLVVVDALDTRAVLIKGAALVQSVYGGEFRRRPMADIDLLVDASRAADVQRTLLASEWRATVAPERTEAYHEHHHLPPLRDAGGSGVRLEIHTELFARGHPFRLTAEMLRAEAQRLSWSGSGTSTTTRVAYVPALPHQLLHTCLHFTWSHVMKFGAWRTFRDVRAIIGSNRVDWGAFVDLARVTRASTACYWTFRLADTVAGVHVPADVCDALRPPRSTTYLFGLERHYLLNLFAARRVCPSVRLDRALWEMGMMPSWSGYAAARPWDRDSQFITGDSVPRRWGLARLWRTARYLATVVGMDREPPPLSLDRPSQFHGGALDQPDPAP